MSEQVTAEYIAGKFKEMVRTKPIADISVSMICSESTINRSTFYYYFSNKDKLIRWIIHHDISARFYQASGETWLYNVTLLLKEFHDNAGLYAQVLNGRHADTLKESLYLMTCETNRQGIASILNGRNASEEEITFVISFYAHAFTGMYLDYVRSGAAEEPDVYASRFIPIVDEGFFTVVNHLAENE